MSTKQKFVDACVEVIMYLIAAFVISIVWTSVKRVAKKLWSLRPAKGVSTVVEP